MSISGATIRTALASIGAVGKQVASFDELAAGADGALRRAPGLTKEGAAAFLATCAQESAYFRSCVEYGGQLRYDPYRGRTFTMITWSQNYRDFGRWCAARNLVNDSEYFVKNPKALGELRWAWLGPIQYWEENGIWRWANRGQFRETSQAINGGNGRVGTSFTPHGWRERQAMYAAFRLAGDALLPAGGPTPSITAPAQAAPTPPPPRRRNEDQQVFIETPDPPADTTPKIEWPRKRLVYAFDPIGGWGGKCILRVNFGPRGGWLHLARWWIRLPDWSPNNRHRMKFWDHPVGAQGTDFAIAADWQTAPPVGASSIELDLSAPDGVHIQMIYEK